MISVYQMAINNTAAFIRSPANRKVMKGLEEYELDAFTASVVLAAAFCKLKEEVMADILSVPDLPR